MIAPSRMDSSVSGGSSGDILMFAKRSSGNIEVSSLTGLADADIVVARTVPWSLSHLSFSFMFLFTNVDGSCPEEGVDPSKVVITEKLVTAGGTFFSSQMLRKLSNRNCHQGIGRRRDASLGFSLKAARRAW